jgi:hypothetical protein
MIVFDLHCRQHHVFEAWFDSSSDYEKQNARKMIGCPLCGDTKITKAPSAPNVSAKSNQRVAKSSSESELSTAAVAAATPDAPTVAEMKDMMAKLAELQEKVETSHEDVGDTFPEEVRKIHYGESEHRPIYGEATIDEAKELQEEGIEILPLPFQKKKNRRLDA